MNKLRITFLAIITLSLSSAGAAEIPFAHPGDVGMSASKLRKIEDAVGKHMDANTLAGAVTVVLKDGKLIHKEAHGWKDIENKQRMTEDSIFRIYSMTKPIVSLGLMILRDEGKFELDDPVSKHISEFKGLKLWTDDGLKEPKREMTVRDLMRHTSGLTYGFFGNTPVDQKYRAAQVLAGGDDSNAFIKKLSGLPLLYAPGDRWVYSVSVDVQGVLIERLTGKSLAAFLNERIFKPLDMKDTAFSITPDKQNRFTTAYSPLPNGSLSPTDKPATSRYNISPRFYSGGGGLVSTIRDYSHFAQMMVNGGELFGKRIIKESTIKEITDNHLNKPAYPIGIGDVRDGFGFGLGVYVVTQKSNWDADARVAEYGWDGAASTHLWISPKDKLAVITMEQTMPFNPQLIKSLKGIVYDAIK